MMTVVFLARYARATGDRGLLGLAARQTRQYAALLKDPGSGLWRHSWWKSSERPHPRGKLFWGRGNGWVVASLPMILECLPDGQAEKDAIITIFGETSEAILRCQRGDGWFPTLLGRPGKGQREASATALIAGGWMRGLRLGFLDGRFREPALRAFRAVVDSLEHGTGGAVHLPMISGPTIPLPHFPYAGYRLVPRGRNHPYGIAALILAGIEYRRLTGAG